MSCVNVLDNDSTLSLPVGPFACAQANVPTCDVGDQQQAAGAWLYMTFKMDGTWEVGGNANGSALCGASVGTPNGVVATGSWLGAGSPADYEIRIVEQTTYETDTFPAFTVPAWCPGLTPGTTYSNPQPSNDSGWMDFTAPRSSSALSHMGFLPAFGGTQPDYCAEERRAVNTVSVQIRSKANPANAVSATYTLCATTTNNPALSG